MVSKAKRTEKSILRSLPTLISLFNVLPCTFGICLFGYTVLSKATPEEFKMSDTLPHCTSSWYSYITLQTPRLPYFALCTFFFSFRSF